MATSVQNCSSGTQNPWARRRALASALEQALDYSCPRCRTDSGNTILPLPAPPLPTDVDALPSTFEVNGRNYPDTAILRNALPGPAFRAPGLSIPAGLTHDGLPVGFEIDGLPGGDDQLLRLGMAMEAVLGPLPPPTFATVETRRHYGGALRLSPGWANLRSKRSSSTRI
jgi:hypothetical protein